MPSAFSAEECKLGFVEALQALSQPELKLIDHFVKLYQGDESAFLDSKYLEIDKSFFEGLQGKDNLLIYSRGVVNLLSNKFVEISKAGCSIDKPNEIRFRFLENIYYKSDGSHSIALNYVTKKNMGILITALGSLKSH